MRGKSLGLGLGLGFGLGYGFGYGFRGRGRVRVKVRVEMTCEATDMSMYLSPKVIVMPAIRLGSSLVSTVTLPEPPVCAVG